MQIVGVQIPPPAPWCAKIIVERLLPMKCLSSISEVREWSGREAGIEMEGRVAPGDNGGVAGLTRCK